MYIYLAPTNWGYVQLGKLSTANIITKSLDSSILLLIAHENLLLAKSLTDNGPLLAIHLKLFHGGLVPLLHGVCEAKRIQASIFIGNYISLDPKEQLTSR